MVKLKNLSRIINAFTMLAAAGLTAAAGTARAANGNLSSPDDVARASAVEPATAPFGVGGLGVAPLVMLTLGREHNLFSEAYSDYTDIDGDGRLDIMFDPSIDYYGLFDSSLCYEYNDGTSGVSGALPEGFGGFWRPTGKARLKSGSLPMWGEERGVRVCPGGAQWSGNFLNYLTSSRIDVIKKVLYGGTRAGAGNAAARYAPDDSAILAHSRVLRDAHAWGKVLGDKMYGGAFTVSDFAGLQDTGAGNDRAWFFVVASPDEPGYKLTSSYMRYGLVDDAGMPGVDSESARNFIWDWASRQSSDNQYGDDAIASPNQKRINRSDLANGSQPTGQSLFSGAVREANIAVAACSAEYHDNDSCKNYGTEANPVWQPVGLLQQYGEGASPRMKFGLITGSWENNRTGAALRANIGDFGKEVVVAAGGGRRPGDFDYSAVRCTNGGSFCGIVPTLDRFRVAQRDNGKEGGEFSNYKDCRSWSGANDGDNRADNTLRYMSGTGTPRCSDWGNPVGVLLYETARYFRNMPLFNEGTGKDENDLGIGHVAGVNPYPDGSPTYCAKPVAMVLADENVTFDSDSFNGGAFSSDTGAVVAETRNVSGEYGLKPGSYFMGGVRGKDSGPYEFIPSRKEIADLSEVIGIAPAAAFSYGSYNVAGVASLYSRNPMLKARGPNGNASDQYLSTYVVAMQPNLPQINLNVGGATVEILPFAKTPARVLQLSSSLPAQGAVVNLPAIGRDHRILMSTNQVADFYVQKLSDTEGEFRINYEDFEYGSDYDMDWVVLYKYQVLRGAGGSWYVRLQLSHADGDRFASQHAGYVITGVENEGVYVDLAKVSANAAATDSGSNGNLYELDNMIGDAAIISCSRQGKNDLADVMDRSSGYGAAAKMACLLPERGMTEDDYANYFWSAANIDSYYDNHIKNNAGYYYANRRALYDAGYTAFADFSDYGVPGMSGKLNFRLGGDRYASAGRNGGYVSSRVFKVKSAGGDSGWLKTPLWFAAKYGINAGYAPSRAKPEVEPDNYYLVTNPTKLRDGIAEMLNKIDQSFKSGSSFTAAGGELRAGGAVYGSNYDPSTWYGSLEKIRYDSDYRYTASYDWNAARTFAAASPDDRLIMTMDYAGNRLVRLYAEDIDYDSSDYGGYADSSLSSGVAAYAGLDIVRKLVNEDAGDEVLASDPDYLVYADKLVRWMLGEHKYEGLDTSENVSRRIARNDNKPLRRRAEELGGPTFSFVLGDIINSDAVVFSPASGGKQFLAVGANDGMLHIIDEADGSPVVSYVPSVMLSSLGRLVRETYASDHYPFVDSTPQFFRDRDTGKAYLYGAYGMGFKGGYVLNVTGVADLAGKSPEEKFGILGGDGENPLLLWELTEKQTVRDADGDPVITMGSEFIGRQRLAPALIRHPEGPEPDAPAVPYLIYGSGYDADRQGIVMVDMLYRDDHDCGGGSAATFTPCVVNEVEVSAEDPWGYGRKNAFAPVATYSETVTNEYAAGTQGYVYRALYWGDLFGNVWKIDLDSLDAGESGDYYDVTNWGVAGDSVPKVIFRAADGNNAAQPITAKIAVGFDSGGGIGLLFGTGSIWTKTDQEPVSKRYNENQTLYMIRDFNAADPEVNASGEKPVRRCETPGMVTSPTNRCLVRMTESLHPDGRITAEADSSLDLTNAKLFGWYLDVYSVADDALVARNSGARLYRDVNIVDGTRFSVPVNVPSVDDPCGGGGASYVLYGNWNFRNGTVSFDATDVNRFLLSEGRTYVDAEGNVRTVYSGDKATSEGPSSTVEVTHRLPALRNSSWLRMY